MTLWRKESNKKNALYMDIFKARYDQNWLTQVYNNTKLNLTEYKATHPWQKDDNIAINKRQIGNLLFGQGKYCEAIAEYNKSLCFAEIDSETVSLAYANRSACFFKLKMYEKCLIDIELAKNANYPKRLMSKLEKRHSDCNEFTARGASVQAHKPKLSFDPDEKIPAFANTIKIDNDFRYGRRLIATKSLDVGQTIFLESSFVGESYAEKYTSCYLCLSLNENLISCKNCTVAMFCHGKCENNELHQYECDLKPCPIITHVHAMNIQIPFIRSILLAVRAFTSVDAFIEFVEKTLTSDSSNMEDGFNDIKSKYKVFLKLQLATFKVGLVPLIYSLYQTMLDQTKIAEIFITECHRRFLMHLVMHHHLIFELNISYVETIFPNPINPLQQAKAAVTNQLSILQTLFRHSCTRNVALILDNGSTVGIVLRPIAVGEELCISVDERLPESYQERRKRLKNEFQFQCKCELCESRSDKIPENKMLRLESDFQYIYFESGCTRDQMNEERAEALKAKCARFLQQHGRNRWCKEIEIAIAAYIRMLQTRSVDITSEIFQDAFQQMLRWPCF